jgi:alpha-ketoglutarate-dependent taurine dioxygenase
MEKVCIEAIKPNISGIVHLDKACLLKTNVIEAAQTSLQDRGVLVFPRIRKTSSAMLHPLFWKQPSGRKSLVVDTQADIIVDQPVAHGRSRLLRLQEWPAQPAFSYRHEWSEGDQVIRDD